MVAVLMALGTALALFALAGEATTNWLRIVGFVLATLFTISGAAAGYTHFKK
jgi:hypothetical protein